MAASVEPIYLHTATDVQGHVVPGRTLESIVLDFKAGLDQSPGWQQELARDVSQFANTRGGCLVLGVTEHVDVGTNLKVADRIAGVPDPDKTREQIEQAIKNHVVPATFRYDPVPIRTAPSTVVVAVNVPPCRNVVYVVAEEQKKRQRQRTFQCVYRTSHGKEYMNPDEIERHMMNTARSRMLGLIEALKKAPAHPQVRVAGGFFKSFKQPGPLHPWSSPGLVKLGRIDDDAFELLVPLGGKIQGLSIPYEVLRASWLDVDLKVALLLDVRVVLREDELMLEPFEA